MPSRKQLKAIKQNESRFSDGPYALTVALQTKFHTVFILDLAHHYFQPLRAKLPSVQSLYNSLLFTTLPSEHLKTLSQMIRTINLALPLQGQELQCLKLIRETWQSNSVLIRKPLFLCSGAGLNYTIRMQEEYKCVSASEPCSASKAARCAVHILILMRWAPSPPRWYKWSFKKKILD